MSKKHKRAKKVVNNFQLIDGNPMHICTQWFLIGGVAGVAAVKVIEASMTLSNQIVAFNPYLSSANTWLSIFG